MLVRRLLMAAGGGGGFSLAGRPFVLTAAPLGTGTDIQWPMAITGSGKTFVGIIKGESDENDIGIIQWDNASGSLDGYEVLHAALIEGPGTVPDTHNQPAVALLADGRIITAYSAHASSHMRIRVSTDPYDISGGFGTEYVITSSYEITYPQLAVMAGGRIYLRARAYLAGTAYLIQWYSDDDGASFDIGTLWYTGSTNSLYTAFASDGTYVDTAIIPRSPDYSSGYPMIHLRMDEAGAVYKSDGTLFAGSLPLATSDGTLIFADGSKRFPRGIVYDSGVPVVAWDSAQADPVIMGQSRWDGAAWNAETIMTSTPVYAGATSTGGGKNAWDDPDTFVVGKVLGSDPIDAGGAIEIFRYRRVAGVWDGGTQLTYNGENPYGPFTVVDADPELSMLWTKGDQAPADGDPFSLALEGVGA